MYIISEKQATQFAYEKRFIIHVCGCVCAFVCESVLAQVNDVRL